MLTTSCFRPHDAADAELAMWQAHFAKSKTGMLKSLGDMVAALYSVSGETKDRVVQCYVMAAKHHDTRSWSDGIKSLTEAFSLVASTKPGVQVDPAACAAAEMAWNLLHDDLEFDTDKLPRSEAIALPALALRQRAPMRLPRTAPPRPMRPPRWHTTGLTHARATASATRTGRRGAPAAALCGRVADGTCTRVAGGATERRVAALL